MTKSKPIKLRERVSTDLAKRSQRIRSDVCLFLPLYLESF